MAAKPGNKWKSVSKSVIGVMATKIATENPDKQFDNLKAFLDRTKKQMIDLANTQGTKEVLEEKILRTRAILITFESRKSQLDNVLENIQQQNENENDIFKNEWNSLEEQTKNILKELESVSDQWKGVNELSDKINHLLSQLDSRRESCCTLDSAIEITSCLQNLKEENLKSFSSLLQKLKNIVKNLAENNNDDELTTLVTEYEEKMNKKQAEIGDTLKSLEAKAEREKKFEELREKFRKNLDNSLEILKNIRNEECDTDELETCLNLVKKLNSTKSELFSQFQKIDEETKSLNIERYFRDFEHLSQIWNTFCHELESCQQTLETQTNESRKVLYLLNNVQREIIKHEKVQDDLMKVSMIDKAQLQQIINQIKNSLECLNGVYTTMESFTHQWEKLKKNGLSDDMIENKLQNTSEKLNSLQYEFQNLLEKSEETLNTVDRVDEDCQKIKKNIASLNSNLAKVRLSEEDTNSDIQAKLSKIDQKLLEPCWDLIENIESFNENLPETFSTHLEAKNLKIQLNESDKEFANVRSQLSQAMTLLNQFGDLCNKTTTDLNEIRNAMMPNMKKLSNLEEKIDALNRCKIVEAKLKEIGKEELKQISDIQTNLNLIMCKKPAKDVTNKWKDLIQTCLENITELSRDILKTQTKINKRTEFINWVQSTKESIEQMTATDYHFDKLTELESLQSDLNELQLNLKEKQDESRELESDTEREELQEQLSAMTKQIGHSLESLSTINTFWNEYDLRLERLSSWLKSQLKKFNEVKNSEKLNEKLSNLKELLCDVQGKENKINDLNCDAQKLNSMINSYHILQQSCSLINLKSQLRDDIENEIQFVDKWLFVKNQLKSLNQQITSICNKIITMVISDDDIEDQINLIEEVQMSSIKFDEDLNKIKDNYDFEYWPKELMNEFAAIDERYVKLKNDVKTKMDEVQKIMQDENEKRLLSVAKSHECTPTVYETVEELPSDFDIHFLGGGRKTSLKLNKFSKYRNRTNSSLFKRRRTKTLIPPRKQHQSEGDQGQTVVMVSSDREGSTSSSVDSSALILPDFQPTTFTDHESSVESSAPFDRESSTTSTASIPVITVSEHVSLWERLRQLTERVRMIDLTRSAATATMKVLLVLMVDVRRLWLAHGDFDFYNFDEINLHQSIQFVQLDILRMIEECIRLIDSTFIVDNIISQII